MKNRHPGKGCLAYILTMVIKKQVRIVTSAELVWDVITDLRNAKEWAPGFEDYPYISPEWPGRGAKAIWRYHAGFLHFDFNLLLEESDRGRALRISNKSTFGTGVEIYRFSFSGTETTVDYEARTTPNFLGRLFAAVMKPKLENQM